MIKRSNEAVATDLSGMHRHQLWARSGLSIVNSKKRKGNDGETAVKKKCKCGSESHARTTHRDCPMNRNNCNGMAVATSETLNPKNGNGMALATSETPVSASLHPSHGTEEDNDDNSVSKSSAQQIREVVSNLRLLHNYNELSSLDISDSKDEELTLVLN
jgi:hypothetical protein